MLRNVSGRVGSDRHPVKSPSTWAGLYKAGLVRDLHPHSYVLGTGEELLVEPNIQTVVLGFT